MTYSEGPVMGVWCRIFFSFAFAVLIAMGSWTYTRADAPNGDESIVAGRVLLKPKQGIDAVRALSSLGDEEVRVAASLPQLGYLVLSVPPGTEREWARRLSSSTFVENAQPEFIYRLLLNPNDFWFYAYKGENSLYQWNLRTINAPSAWDINTGSSDITIAIVDTGVDDRHDEFAGKVTLKADFINELNPFDGLGFHATHVAGIAAARTNNATGIAAVSWGAKIMSVKVADHFGKAPETIAAQGIVFAADNGANIINLSFGGEEESKLMQDAVDYAYNKGILVVAAAGNCADPDKFIQWDCKSLNPPIYPAAGKNVLAVGANNEQNQRPSYAEHLSYIAVAAPGDDILSTLPNQGYGRAGGTSMAAPHVSALASLIWSVNPSFTNAQVANIITSTVTDLGPAGKDDDFGYGLINARAALVKASEPTPT
ncbi:MAG: S8 family serine peptidase, partial [Dehalococcoidia bacterium]|nr:S8 family serine peptidase [Dehalococcoidia bacterium]